MDKKATIFERILQIVEYYNIKGVNSFAKDYLGYNSSEKIRRLKDYSKRPSIEILEDIANKFADIDLNWLVSGNGDMLKNEPKHYKIPKDLTPKAEDEKNEYESLDKFTEIIKNQFLIKDKIIDDLIKHQEVLLNQISKLTDKIK